VGYRRPRHRGGQPSVVAANRLQGASDVDTPNMDDQGMLLLGSDMDALTMAGLDAGEERARENLNDAAALAIDGNTLKVINLTGHELISGYPEGRRMWLNIVWKDVAGATLREDGAYGPITVDFDVNNDGDVNASDVVESLLNLNDTNMKVYEVYGAITQDWAAKLISVGFNYGLVLGYDRITEASDYTLGQVAAQASGTAHETFHFVLNNMVVKDNRIPPYGMRYDDAAERSILPVPASQFGNPGAGGVFKYWDEFSLNPPESAATATISLMYQPTSWEYIEFLARANNSSVSFLADEGENLLDGWLNTGMAEPYVMASTTWTSLQDEDNDGVPDDSDNCTLVPNADQRDTDGDDYGNMCDADFDNSGTVDAADLGFFRSRYSSSDPDADLSGDGFVSATDLAMMRSLYMKPPGPSGYY